MVNFKLAEAYLKINDLPQAKIFIKRAWVLSKFSPDILPLYIVIHSALKDIDAIRCAYKRLGTIAASQQNITEALEYFNLWQKAYVNHLSLDKYEFDFDILERIEEMAKPHRFEPKFKPGLLKNRKTRLAYLMFGMTHVNSVLVRIKRIFAKYHDKSGFEVAFFVPESEKAILDWPQATDNIKRIREHDCHVVVAPNSMNDSERLLEVGAQIYNYQPDLLITSALLANLSQYFITCLHPAPVTIGFVQGPPPQFVSPNLDWSIAWVKQPLIDSPCDCSLVGLEFNLPNPSVLTFYRKQQFKIPDDGIVMMSGGRYPKFQDLNFWKTILKVLSSYPNAYYIAVGINENDIPFVDTLITSNIKERIRFLGWREDYLEILGLADIVIDTFPSGGGVLLMDAMAFGIPVITFKNNYMRLFDQTDWSPGEEIISIPDLIVERGKFIHLENLLSKLIDEREFRSQMADQCKKQALLKRGNPDRMVRKCEDIYLKVLEQKFNATQDRYET